MVENQISIGRFSQICRLTIKALRVYEKRGLLVPENVDSLTGYRYYAASQINRGVVLAQLAWAKFSLDEMGEFVARWEQNQTGGEDLMPLIESKLNAIEEQTRHLANVKEFLTKFISSNDKKIYDRIETKQVAEIRVLSCRELGSYGETTGKLIGQIFRYIHSQPQQELIRVSGPVMFLCYDDEYKETGADIEIAVPITGPIKGTDKIQLKKLEKCDVISTIHQGPYDQLNSTYQIIYTYIQEKKLQVLSPNREIYLNSPQNATPDQYMTEIQFPIKFY